MSELLAFFDNAPAVDIAIPDFYQALDRAAADKKDDAAFALVNAHLDLAYERGDLARLQEYSVVLGAMACMHDHLQPLAGLFDVMLSGADTDGHQHPASDHDHLEDDEYEVDPVTGKRTKKKKRRNQI